MRAKSQEFYIQSSKLRINVLVIYVEPPSFIHLAQYESGLLMFTSEQFTQYPIRPHAPDLVSPAASTSACWGKKAVEVA